MFQLPLPFFRKKDQVDPKNLMDKNGEEKPKRERKKKEIEKPWGLQERLIVGGVLIVCFLAGAYFWFRGNGQVPDGSWFRQNFSWPSFEQKIILE